MYSGYGITFVIASEWSFHNGTARNVIIFGVDNSSPSHSENRKNNLLILGNGPTFGINGNLVHQRKNLVLILLKQILNFA